MWTRRVLVLPALLSLASCGTYVPQIQEVWDQDYVPPPGSKTPRMPGTAQIEYEILNRVRCDLALAIKKGTEYPVTGDQSGKVVRRSLVPLNYQVQVALTLEVDESTSFNPGVALNTPIHNATTNFGGEYIGTASPSPLVAAQTYSALSSAQSYAFGLGGTLSATSTRKDTYNPIWPVSDLLNQVRNERNECSPDRYDAFEHTHPPFTPAKSSFLITSELGIEDWLIPAITNTALFGESDETKRQATSPAKLEKMKAELSKEGYTPSEVTLLLAAQEPAKSLEQRREELAKKGYNSAEITQIVASQAGLAVSGTTGNVPKYEPQAVSLEIKFVVVTSGNATPTWKLVRVSANTGAPLFGVGRTRTHDLIITVGPNNANATNAHLASQIGAAVQGSATGQ